MNEAAPLWQNAREGVLVIPFCAACDRFAWPPRARCTHCAGTMSWKKATGAGIVSFRKPGVDSGAIVRQLNQRHIVMANRSGWVRTSPHFYISPEEIERMIAELP